MLFSGVTACFDNETGWGTTDETGVWAMGAITDRLWIGFAKRAPAYEDGAMLAYHDGTTITAVYSPTEQGLADMEVVTSTGRIWVPGNDPCCGDGWDYGNIYEIFGTSVVKHRTVPSTVHAYGAYYDTDDGTLWLAIHRQEYDGVSGYVVSSTDAVTWSEPNAVAQCNTVRDIIRDRATGWYYATAQQCAEGTYGLLQSPTGESWTYIENDVDIDVRLVAFRGWIVAVLRDGRLFSIQRDGETSTQRYHSLPFTPSNYWNVMANGRDGYLYAIDNRQEGGVWRSSDLENWTLWTETGDGPLTAITYWPNQDKIVVAGLGCYDSIWLVD